MNFPSVRKTLAPWIKNIGGWQTNRKIVVIESDDWGSIRMPSRETYETLLQAGYRVDKIAYERYGSLASETDLELLFDLLSSYKDPNGNHPVLTANALAANPDFEKIKASGYSSYHYESIKETFSGYPEHSRCFQLWGEGLGKGVFFPQSHGREHLNVSMFMNALREGNTDLLFGFKHHLPGCIPHGDNPTGGNPYVESLRYSGEKDKEQKLEIILEGLDLFEQLFGYRSQSFIPPNYLWSPDYDEAVSKKGVRFYQGTRKMKEPQFDGTVNYNKHKLGDSNSCGQHYLVRNALFEPSLFKMKIKNPVEHCLKSINAAFTLNKPAIICSHRINFVGYIDPGNRDRNLVMLAELISTIQKRWPDTEFLTSADLGNLIAENSKQSKFDK